MLYHEGSSSPAVEGAGGAALHGEQREGATSRRDGEACQLQGARRVHVHTSKKHKNINIIYTYIICIHAVYRNATSTAIFLMMSLDIKV